MIERARVAGALNQDATSHRPHAPTAKDTASPEDQAHRLILDAIVLRKIAGAGLATQCRPVFWITLGYGSAGA